MKHHHHYHHQNHHHHHNFTIIITSIIVIVLIITSSRKKGTKQLLKDFLAFVFSLCWEKSGYSCITKFVRLNKAFVDAMHVKVNVIIVIYIFKSCLLFYARLLSVWSNSVSKSHPEHILILNGEWLVPWDCSCHIFSHREYTQRNVNSISSIIAKFVFNKRMIRNKVCS